MKNIIVLLMLIPFTTIANAQYQMNTYNNWKEILIKVGI